MGRRWRRIHGNLRSRAAQEAEFRCEMPLTRAIEAVYTELECKNHGVSRRQVHDFLIGECGCGWHHVAGPTCEGLAIMRRR